MDRRVLIVLLAVVVGLATLMAYYLVGYRSKSRVPGRRLASTWDGDPRTLVENHRGRVLVLLLGMEGCDGTRAAMQFLRTYAAEKPDEAVIVRLDVPPPVGEFKTADPAKVPFACGVDRDRLLATKLGFFYYPTLYIFDRQGELRFAGECDPERVPRMVTEIVAERPGSDKHVYTKPLPAVGTAAPAFTGETLDGDRVTLEELRGAEATVLIFAKTKCRFTMRAFPTMQRLADDYEYEGVRVAIVNRGEPVDKIRPIYAERAPGVTVVVDEARDIANAYSISAAPFVFLLDADGKIAARMPFTFEGTSRAIDGLLGAAPRPAAPPTTGAG